jgi:hypothetical protein
MMKQHEMPSVFHEADHTPESFWEVVAAWIIVILVLVATSVGFLLDHAATLAP